MHPYSGSSLLLLGLVQLGACSDDGFVNQGSSQSSTSTTGHDGSEGPAGVTGPPATAPDDDTALPTGDTSSASGPMDTSSSSAGTTAATSEGTTAATSEGTTAATSEGTTTGGPNQDCADGCVVEFLCGTQWRSEADCVMACEDNLLLAADFSIFCRAAWEGVSACVATLTCEEFEQWENPMMFPYPCSDADTVLASECEGQ